jgi:hypothetical protein
MSREDIEAIASDIRLGGHGSGLCVAMIGARQLSVKGRSGPLARQR